MRDVHKERTPEIYRRLTLNIQLNIDQCIGVKKAGKGGGKNHLKELEVAVPSTQMVLKTVPVSTSQTGNHQDSQSIEQRIQKDLDSVVENIVNPNLSIVLSPT